MAAYAGLRFPIACFVAPLPERFRFRVECEGDYLRVDCRSLDDAYSDSPQGLGLVRTKSLSSLHLSAHPDVDAFYARSDRLRHLAHAALLRRIAPLNNRNRETLPDVADKTGMIPKFSIIIPIYNVAPYIRETLESVFAQTHRDFELICVDDGSTDGSGAILDEYSGHARIIHQPNKGVSAARNRGLAEAKGEWVAFIDGDDLWHPHLLELVSEKAADDSVDIVHFGITQFKEDARPVWKSCVECSVYSGWFVQKVYRRALIDDLRFPSYRIGEDTSFMNRVCARARKAAFIPQRLYGYRQRGASSSHRVKSMSDLSNIFGYALDSLKAYAESIIPVPVTNCRLMANNLTEASADLIFKCPRASRKELLNSARKTWNEALSLKSLNSRQKLRIRLFNLLPIMSIAWLLFVLPYRLKTQGLHR